MIPHAIFLKQVGHEKAVHDPEFRPLRDPPRPDRDKVDQILEWAQTRVAAGSAR